MTADTYLTLQPSDGSDDDLNAVVELSQRLGVRLDVLITGIAMPALSFEGVPSGWVEFCESIHLAVTRKRDSVEATLQAQNVPATVSAVFSDIARFSGEIEQHALCSDVVVVPNRAMLDTPVGKLLFNTSLFHSRKPIWVLSEDKAVTTERIVVGWKSDPHAAASIHHALPLLRRARSVVLTTVDPNSVRDGANPGHQMASYLAHHGVEVLVDNRPSGGKSAAAVLTQCAVDHSADLIVTGAFGRSRVRDWVLGSCTRELLASESVSVFLAH